MFAETAETFALEVLESERAGAWSLRSLGQSTFLGWDTVSFIATNDLDDLKLKVVIDQEQDGLRYSDCAVA